MQKLQETCPRQTPSDIIRTPREGMDQQLRMTLALKHQLHSSEGEKGIEVRAEKTSAKSWKDASSLGEVELTAGYRNAFSTKYSATQEQHSTILIANRTLAFTPAAEPKEERHQEKPLNGKCSEDGKIQTELGETEAFEAAQVYRHPMCCVSLFYCCLYHPP